MRRILWVRHGETEWNRERRIMGREDIGLNETGREQSRRLAKELAEFPIDAFYSSPILRARETAEILANSRSCDVSFDDRLWEVDYGEWVGKRFAEIRQMPGYVPYYQRLDSPVAPGGETLYQVRDRALSFLNELKNSESPATIAIVSHADTIKCLLMELLGMPFQNIWRLRIDNVSVSLIESDESMDRIICINQRGDMDRLFATRPSF